MINTSQSGLNFTVDDKRLNELITNVAFKKVDALSELYRLTRVAVYGFALSILKSHSDAKVVLHNTFLSVWVSAYMYTSEGKPMPWLMMIAQNHCFKVLRNRKWYDSTHSLEENTNKAFGVALGIEEGFVLDAFQNVLDDDEREIVMLSTVTGLSTMNISHFLNIPFLKVVSKRNNAFKKLKRACKDEPAFNQTAVGNSFIKECIKSSVAKTTCNNWNSIAFDLSNQKGEVITQSDKKPKSKVLSLITTLIALFIVLSLVIFGITNYNRADLKPVSTVYFESTMQIELSLNTYNVVLEATAKNPDGEKVLSGTNLKDSQLDSALDAIFTSLVKNGYLSEKSNFLIVKVENSSTSKAISLQNLVSIILNKAIKGQKLDLNAVVLRDYVGDNKTDIITNAEKYKVSNLKAEFICFLQGNDVKKSFEELEEFSLKELVELFKGVKSFKDYLYGSNIQGKAVYVGKEAKEPSVSSTQSTNKLDSIIAPEDAIKKAILHAGLVSNRVTDAKAEFNDDNGDYRYNVKFSFGGYAYNYEVDAISGKIIKTHKEAEKQNQ